MEGTVLVIVVVVLMLGLGLIGYAVMLYNGLITVKNNVDKYWSNIDVLLKQRFDELPKLVAICERYMKHEADTLLGVTKARAAMAGAKSVRDMGKAQGMITEALKSLFAVTENYPELKADRRFGQLQTRVSELEDEIADRRELFNESVNIYNIRIQKIPDNIVAGLMGLRDKDLWQIEAAHRVDPGIKFSS